jgi:hypothetical protein
MTSKEPKRSSRVLKVRMMATRCLRPVQRLASVATIVLLLIANLMHWALVALMGAMVLRVIENLVDPYSVRNSRPDLVLGQTIAFAWLFAIVEWVLLGIGLVLLVNGAGLLADPDSMFVLGELLVCATYLTWISFRMKRRHCALYGGAQ